MSSIFYLWKTSFKNQLINLKNHPLQLILMILLLFFAGAGIFSSLTSQSGGSDNNPFPMAYLGALIILMFLFLIGTEIKKGLSSGGSFFTMADVNLLFLSPVSPRKILAYGLIKQIGVSLLLGIFILFQGSTLKIFFGIGFLGMAAIFLGYCIFLILGEILALAIYSFSNGDTKKKQLLKNLLYCFVFLIAALFLTTLAKNQNFLEALIQTANSPMVEYIPIVGWAKGFIIGLLTGQFLMAAVYFLLMAALSVLLIVYLCRSESDYYEDVLQATETAYHTKAAAKQGHLSDTKDTSKINRNKTGIGHGKGASVFFFKHLLENKRSGYLFLNQFTLITAIIAIVISIFGREYVDFIFIFSALCYMQFLTSSMGRWVKELPLPYIYLIPKSPFKKLIFASLESLIDSLVSGLIIFIPCGLILGTDITLILAAIVSRVALAALLSAGNILIERLLGSMQNKILTVIFYFIILIVLIIPGLIVAIISYFTLGSLAVALFIDALVNCIIAVVIIALCRNLLHNIELNV